MLFHRGKALPAASVFCPDNRGALIALLISFTRRRLTSVDEFVKVQFAYSKPQRHRGIVKGLPPQIGLPICKDGKLRAISHL
jgi:hypothetical protein